MIVIANGAFKSGSTWQRNLLKGLMDFQPLPENFQSKKHDSFVGIDRLADIVKSSEIKSNNYLAKGHIYKKDHIELLASNEDDVKIFMIQRDIRDAIVSHYNHFINVRSFKPSFKTYYWLVGRYKAIQLAKYNKNWESFQNNVYHSTFESLKKDTPGELKRFAEFLGVTLNQKQIEDIIEANSIKKVRENSPRKWFFRKGEIGDYKNYLTASMEKDLERIQKKNNLLDKLGYYLIFELRRSLS
ncbi:sulfotransferase domain-containing protein [Flagellimonas sp.]|uniref:sulfotransferase domain-containing protein n=1 Tax=Flagellimonas sp. TaxID=2058762 RepID=UPI003BB10CB2